MSGSQAYEEISLDNDGISVTKRYEKDDFPVPAIAFSFESDREVAVTVTLRDDVPPNVAVEDLGFHPEYGSEFWEIDDDAITFEREVTPGEQYTTVYGIRATGTDDIDQFLTVPRIEVDPPLMEDIPREPTEIPDVDDGEGAAETEAEADEDVDTLDLKDPNDAGSADSGSTESGGTESTDTGIAVTGDTLVEALANELRENAVSKEDVTLLRKAFDLAAEERESVRARIEKLQGDVSKVIAYTDALEEFLDENGTAEEIVRFQERFDDVQSELESISSRLDERAEEMDTLADDVATVESNVDGVADTVEDVDDTVSDFEARIQDLEADFEDLDEQIGSMDVDEEVEDIREDIRDLKEWREQLSSVIGGS